MKTAAVPHLLRLVLAAALIAGCSAHPDKDRADRPENPFKSNHDGPGGPKTPKSDKELRLEADELYRRANQALADNDYQTAIERYGQLTARYPFSDYATQAEMEKVYAHYRNYQADEAISAADRFLREHPRHPHADYVQYLKGLVNAQRDESFTDFLPMDSSKKDVSNEHRAFDDFALLLQRYPTSPYAGDARRRMLYLRNRVADHDLSVVKFYIKRGAYVAAAKRAEDIIAQYPGAPATTEALKLLELSDRRIGLTTEADEVARLIAANPKAFAAAAVKPGKKVAPTVYAADEPGTPPPKQRGWLERVGSSLDVFGKPGPTPAPPPAAADSRSAPTATPAPPPSVVIGGAAPRMDTRLNGQPLSSAPPPAAAADDGKPAQDTPQAAVAESATPKKRGFLGRIADLFGSRRKPGESPTQPQTRTPTTVDNTGTTVPANEPGK